MRRALLFLLMAFAALLVSVPALAADSTEDHGSEGATEHMDDEGDDRDEAADDHVEEAGAFGEGEWDGLLAAGAAAAVFGIVVFVMSNAGIKDEPHAGDHH